MTREEAIQAIEVGIEIAQEAILSGADVLATGEMGIGNTTPSSAITATITSEAVSHITGRGTGIDEDRYRHKIDIIRQAIEVNKPNSHDGLDILSKIGGFEIGGLAGVILAGAAASKPVMIDGFISGAAALIAATLKPEVKDYMIAAHVSVESGHQVVLDHLGLKPLINLELRLGEGTGAALGLTILDAAIKILTEMATFSHANVSGSQE
jgi:nicotinate-nucleotide--dimethylbenzimidazole phosphoribosyltransferase